MKITNRIKAFRAGRGMTAAELAVASGVSRQTIYAMEAGFYVPNTTTALRMARALEVKVEELFHLEPERLPSRQHLTAEVLARPSQISPGQPVRLCRVGNRTLAIPATPRPAHLPAADGVAMGSRARRSAEIQTLPDFDEKETRLLIAGCDPGISILRDHLHRTAGLEMIVASCPSRQALEWLKAGKVHVAGSHLRDPRTNEYNLAAVRRLFPRGGVRMVTFAVWEEGLVVNSGNPKGIRGVEDLARKDVAFINRQPGSGSRDLLERQLKIAGIPASRVRGYHRTAEGHLEAALVVSAGEADCCVAARSAAKAFGLHFIPWAVEQYDLVTLAGDAALPGNQTLFDVLNRSALRRELEMLAGYDTAQTGALRI